MDKKSFACSGSDLCNSLPLTVRDPSLSLTRFCAQLKLLCSPEHNDTFPQRVRDRLGCKVCANIIVVHTYS